MIKSRLSQVLTEKGMKVTDLIKRSGLARETVFRAKKDLTISSCTLGTLETIAKTMEVRIADLFQEI